MDIIEWLNNYKETKSISYHTLSVEMNCIVSADTLRKLMKQEYVSGKTCEKIEEWIKNYEQII